MRPSWAWLLPRAGADHGGDGGGKRMFLWQIVAITLRMAVLRSTDAAASAAWPAHDVLLWAKCCRVDAVEAAVLQLLRQRICVRSREICVSWEARGRVRSIYVRVRGVASRMSSYVRLRDRPSS